VGPSTTRWRRCRVGLSDRAPTTETWPSGTSPRSTSVRLAGTRSGGSGTTEVWTADPAWAVPPRAGRTGRPRTKVRSRPDAAPAQAVREIVRDLPAGDWIRHRVTEGEKGPREYEFARLRVFETFAPPRPPEGPIPAGGHLVCVGSDHPAARHPLSTSPFSAAITGGFMPIQACRQHRDGTSLQQGPPRDSRREHRTLHSIAVPSSRAAPREVRGAAKVRNERAGRENATVHDERVGPHGPEVPSDGDRAQRQAIVGPGRGSTGASAHSQIRSSMPRLRSSRTT